MSKFQIFDLVVGICGLSGFTVLGSIKKIQENRLNKKIIKYNMALWTAGIIFGLSATCMLFILHPWSKFHYGDQPKQIVYVDSSKIKNIKPMPILPQQKQPAAKPVSGLHSGHKYSKKPHLTITQDTAKQTSKYDLSHANVTQSAIGDNPTVNNYNEKKARVLTNTIFLSILVKLPKNKDVRINFTQTATADDELLNYLQQIGNALMQNGYTNLNRSVNTAFGVPIKFGLVEVINGTDESTIVVHPAASVK